MKIGRCFGVVLGITAALGFGVMATGVGMPQADAAPSPVAGVCPNTFNLANSGQCNVELILDAGGTLNTVVVDSTHPYDGSEDQLVGVINEDPNANISSIGLTGSGIFGLDGDGICTYQSASTPSGILGYCTSSQVAGTDPQDYQGPDNTFAVTNANSGTVNFSSAITDASGTGIAGTPNNSTFFSLEEAPSQTGFGSTSVGTTPINATPEPGSLALLGTVGLGMLPMLRKRTLRK